MVAVSLLPFYLPPSTLLHPALSGEAETSSCSVVSHWVCPRGGAASGDERVGEGSPAFNSRLPQLASFCICVGKAGSHLSRFPELLLPIDPSALGFYWLCRSRTIHTTAIALSLNSHGSVCTNVCTTSLLPGPDGCPSLSRFCGILALVTYLILESATVCFWCIFSFIVCPFLTV